MRQILCIVLVFTVLQAALSAVTNRRTSRARVEKKIVANPMYSLNLPSNATAIRSDITDNFSCANKAYGYYADVENDCQIFHVCLPVTFADGKERMYRWSFICPEETSFSQEAFTCVRSDELPFDCATSEKFYDLNRNLGVQDDIKEIDSNELATTGGTRNTNQSSQKVTQSLSAATPTFTTITTTRKAPISRTSGRTTVAPTTSRPRRPYLPVVPLVPVSSVAPVSNSNTKPKLQDTNTLLESALKQGSFVKILKAPPVTEVSITENPTTTTAAAEEEEEATELVTTNEPPTTIVRTTPEFLYTRIIPELIESNNFVRVPQVESNLNALLSVQQSSAADDLIRNIKQLQNSLSVSALLSTSSPSSTTATIPLAENPSTTSRVALPRRFLFKADSLRNKLKS